MSSTSKGEATWTVGRLLDWTTAWFQERGVEGGRLAAELLLSRAMGCRKIELYTRFEAEPTEEQRAAFRELVRQAGEHTPIAHLLGSREFFSLEFKVTPAVLIPRPETEALVQRAIELCRQEPERTWRILDVGTGSGCIAVAIARYAPNARVVGSDLSPDALAVAAENVARHSVGERVTLVQADLVGLPAVAFAQGGPSAGQHSGTGFPVDTVPQVPQAGFDLIVSNPPYLSDDAWQYLPTNVREHEPRLALAGGDDGLDLYRRLAAEAPAALAAGGRLLVEVAHDQPASVAAIFSSAARWRFAGSHRDRSDPHERVLEFELA